MIDTKKIFDCWNGIVGWRDTDPPLDNPLLTDSSSGEYYQDFHPALKLDVLKSIVPEDVTLNDWLLEMTKKGIVHLANQIHDEQRAQKNISNIITNQVLIDGHGWSKDTVINQDRFVGIQFRTKNFNSLTNIINNVGIQLNFAPDLLNGGAGLKIYVYHSKLINPVAEVEITGSKAIQWNWSSIDDKFQLDSWNEELDGGVFVIGYYQEDIAGNGLAIKNSSYNWVNGPCGSCKTVSPDRIRGFQMLKKTMDFIPIYVPSSNLPAKGIMFDIEDAMTDPNNNWGLNFKITTSCDYTFFFCQNKQIVREAIGLKVAHTILKEYRFSPRINYLEEHIRSMMEIDIEGAPKSTIDNQEYLPLADRLRISVNGIKFDMEGIDSICLDCPDSQLTTRFGVI